MARKYSKAASKTVKAQCAAGRRAHSRAAEAVARSPAARRRLRSAGNSDLAGQLAFQCGHDTAGESPVEAEGIADGDDLLTDLEIAARADRMGRNSILMLVENSDGERFVALRIAQG